MVLAACVHSIHSKDKPKMTPAKANLNGVDEERRLQANPNGVDEERRFHGLPPLKRFKLLRKESNRILCLPAKKRIWAVMDFTFEQEKAMEEEEEARFKHSDDAQVQNAEKIPSSRKKSQKQDDDSDGVVYKDPKLEDEWSNPKTKASQKAKHKNFNDAQVENKLKRSEKVPRTRGKSLNQAKQEEAEEDDDGVICNVCSGHDGNQTDPIVLCDGCDVMVHASCYGDPLINGIPDGDWFCARCIYSAGISSCCLCPSSKGAMKRTTQNSWAHISCALLVPEVFFKCPEGREGIDCSMVPASRWEVICIFCNMASGACIECSEPRCPSTFHVSCGLARNLHIEYKESKAGGIVVGFCHVHTPKWHMVIFSYPAFFFSFFPFPPE
ncbi:hypothetical protein KI387_041069 [Taxus chinensis]|uniref:Uncharacterized protein n=1 Tax=Taxus chinensis TaxID=29808 RepID=A0AA38FA54_TAXCH|nr:hypothetical protein KI387_041069 [Taxus chinensis]